MNVKFSGTRMKRVILGLSVLVGATSAACASASAKAPPDRPALEVPAPPTKVVEPPARPEPTLEPVPDLPAAPPANSKPARPPVREPTRTDPKPETTTTEAAPPPAPVAPAPQLRQPGTPESAEASKQVQIIIDRAGKSLDSVNPKAFSKARRAVYENARGLLTQAQEALKKSDFDNARKLAEKVEQTAKELGGR
jgi:outer membrane biosynthesis protein TonB